VKYLNEGADFVRKSRREDAYRQMHAACGGAYRIESEGPRSGGSVLVGANDDTAVALDTEYWYIQFSCVQLTAAK